MYFKTLCCELEKYFRVRLMRAFITLELHDDRGMIVIQFSDLDFDLCPAELRFL